MTDDEAKARIEVLHDEAAAILAEQGLLSPLRAYCLSSFRKHEVSARPYSEHASSSHGP